jgi:hypothetical protein
MFFAHYISPSSIITTYLSTLLALEFVLFDSESSLQQISLFLLMHVLQSGSHTGAWVSTCIHDMATVMMLGVIEQRLDSWLSETPCTSVKRFFLTPDYRLSVWIRVKVLLELGPWEWMQLLNTCDGCLSHALLSTMLHQCDVDLTCAENDTLDLVVWFEITVIMAWIWHNPLEVRVTSEFAKGGTGRWMTEEGFTEEEDQSW